MQQCLSLPATAIERAARAIPPDLRNMTAYRAPSFDLPFIVRTAATHEVAAIPLKPAAWILVINPAVLFPHRQRLRRIHFEEVEVRVVPFMRELCLAKPRGRELFATVGQIFSAEHAEFEHFF